MKIDSRFHDFYDNAIAFGVDKKIRYHREVRGPYFYRGSRYSDLNRNDKNYTIPIPMNDFESITRAYRRYLYGDDIDRILYKRKHSFQYVIRNLLFIGQRVFFWYISTPNYAHCTNFKNHNRPVDVYTTPGENTEITDRVNYDNFDVHMLFDSPLVLFQDINYRRSHITSDRGNWREYRRVIMNPILSAIGFQRLMDPFETRQLIENTVISLNCTEVSSDNIPNDCKITSHGFDTKQSFRHRK